MPAIIPDQVLGGGERLLECRDHSLCGPAHTAEFGLDIGEANALARRCHHRQP